MPPWRACSCIIDWLAALENRFHFRRRKRGEAALVGVFMHYRLVDSTRKQVPFFCAGNVTRPPWRACLCIIDWLTALENRFRFSAQET